MKYSWNYCITFIVLMAFVSCFISFGQNNGLQTITENELRYHLEFLGANEFRGRETPSPELEIATLYLANWARHAGLKPLLPSGSFYQTIPISVSSVVQPNSRLRVMTHAGEFVFYYEDSFGGNFGQTAYCYGDVVFAGLGLADPELGWDDLKDLDLYGKVVLILDQQHPDNNFEPGSTYSYRLSSRIRAIRERGAAAVLVIVDPERENRKRNGEKIFAEIPSGRMDIIYDSQVRGPRSAAGQDASENRPARPLIPFVQSDISHSVASAILGITDKEVADLFCTIRRGEHVPGKICRDTRVHLNIEVKVERTTIRNVIGLIEGTDPILKNEYIVICAHHDHLGISDGEIIAGADDNGTGTVALMEIAQALVTEPTKRSVIIAWFTGEERGFIGSQYFVNSNIVPVEKIDACLNMDMLGRNHPDSLYLVGSDLLSSELDASIHRVNSAFNINFRFDYLYSNLTHPQRVYFRSDQYPHVRFGIPSVWFFCGFTPDYHTPGDILVYIDYKKMHRITKLVYLTAFDIGNMNEMLKLDINPEVTSRGKHNLQVRSLFENTR